jgi:hypothetical protein
VKERLDDLSTPAMPRSSPPQYPPSRLVIFTFSLSSFPLSRPPPLCAGRTFFPPTSTRTPSFPFLPCRLFALCSVNSLRCIRRLTRAARCARLMASLNEYWNRRTAWSISHPPQLTFPFALVSFRSPIFPDLFTHSFCVGLLRV